jgi:hypothetical protein
MFEEDKIINKAKQLCHKHSIEYKLFQSNNDLFYTYKLHLPKLEIIFTYKNTEQSKAMSGVFTDLLIYLLNITFYTNNFSSGMQAITEVDSSDRINANSPLNNYLKIFQRYYNKNGFDQMKKSLCRSKIIKSTYPFISSKDANIYYLPNSLILALCGTNGISAGISREVALQKALCQISKNYVRKKIAFSNSINFPTIPLSQLNSLTMESLFQKIQADGIEIIVKDCSLNGSLPVIGLIFKKDDCAVFELGASTNISQAIQECINSLGFNNIPDIHRLLTPINVLPFNSLQRKQEYYDCLQRKRCIFNPLLLQKVKPHTEKSISIFSDKETSSSSEQIIENIMHLGFDVFIRNTSKRGISSYHIYIPGMSEQAVIAPDDLKFHLEYLPVSKNIFFNIKTASVDNIKSLADTIMNLRKYCFRKENSLLSNIHHFSFYENPIINQISLESIAVLLYYQIKKYKIVARIFYKYITTNFTVDELNFPCTQLKKSLSILKLFQYLAQGDSFETAYKKAILFYGYKFFKEIYPVLKNTNLITDYLGIIPCNDCSTCKYRNYCRFPLFKDYYKSTFNSLLNPKKVACIK